MAATRVGRSLHSGRSARGTKRYRRGVLLGAIVMVLFSVLVPAGVVLAADSTTTTLTVTAPAPTTTTEPTLTTTTEPTPFSSSTSVPSSSTTASTEPATVSVAAAALTRYDADSRLSYSGTWANFTKTVAYSGSYKRSSTAGASVTIVFTGEQLDWIAMKGTTTGIADVYLDGAKVATIDLANAVAIYQQNVWSSGSLRERSRTPSGSCAARAAPRASTSTIDAVDIAGTLIPSLEQSDSRLAYRGLLGRLFRPRCTRAAEAGTPHAAGSLRVPSTSPAPISAGWAQGRRTTALPRSPSTETHDV